MKFLENKSGWVVVTGCWLLAIIWPYVSYLLIIVYARPFLKPLAKLSEIVGLHEVTSLIFVSIFICLLPAFILMNSNIFDKKQKLYNLIRLFCIHSLIIGVWVYTSYAATQ
jgi:ethanolamine transporter EutH